MKKKVKMNFDDWSLLLKVIEDTDDKKLKEYLKKQYLSNPNERIEEIDNELFKEKIDLKGKWLNKSQYQMQQKEWRKRNGF